MPSGSLHTMLYNQVNLLEAYRPPSVGTENASVEYEYDLDGLLVSETRANGSLLSYDYDNTGRIETITTPDGVVNHDYFGATPCFGCAPGELRRVTSADGVALEVTRDGVLTTSAAWSGAIAGSVAWGYDRNFRTISEAVTVGSITSSQFFGYDLDGLLTCASSVSCVSPGADALQLTYHPSHGLLTSANLANVNEILTYTTLGEVAARTATHDSTTLFEEICDAPLFPRDDLGRIKRKTETIEEVTTVYDYGYDERGQLTTVIENGTQVAEYGYDANGNRTLQTTSNGTFGATYDAQDRLLTHGALEFTHTDKGELQSKIDTSTGDLTTYQYDVFGNLKSVALPNGDVVEYLVNGKNRRVGKKRNGVLVQQWLYRNQLYPVAELDGESNLVAQFVYGSRINTPDLVIRAGAAYRVLSDQLGSPRLLVNASTGAVAGRMRHDAFGTVLEDTNPGFVPFGFAGGLYDADTGLVRFGSRDYDPTLGRWTTKDPIRFRGRQTNLYIYVNSDPVNYVDPSGEIAPLVVGAIILGSAVASGVAQYYGGNQTGADFIFGAAVGTIGGVGIASGSGAILAVGVLADLIWNTKGGEDPGGVADTVAGCAGAALCDFVAGPAAAVAIASVVRSENDVDARRNAAREVAQDRGPARGNYGGRGALTRWR